MGQKSFTIYIDMYRPPLVLKVIGTSESAALCLVCTCVGVPKQALG